MAAEKYRVPPKLFFALIRQESGWDYKATSYVGAVGLTQIMPFNVKAMGYRLSRFKTSPVAQLECGVKMLRAEFDRFGRWDYALAAYNAGGGAVSRYGGIPPYRETIHYVRNIMYMANYS
ncbi:lytic transglycosylase domain-containing protein [Candidatus Aquicultor secundus]|uniref:lytic transglycosylase domain-containing protein n=1 Tax=Candidatus Aquicultor secundus TaxID=1973895 RepID=UPI00257E71DF|nr:lytic transglycosylase domain-containing protein [Candidatus Aquicultor secundus]